MIGALQEIADAAVELHQLGDAVQRGAFGNFAGTLHDINGQGRHDTCADKQKQKASANFFCQSQAHMVSLRCW